MSDLENCREIAERKRVVCREMHDLAQQQAALIDVLVVRHKHEGADEVREMTVEDV